MITLPTNIGTEDFLTIVLSLGIPLRDSRSLAKYLLQEFGSLPEVLAAGLEKLCSAGLPMRAAEAICLAVDAANVVIRGKRTPRARLCDWMALDRYLDAPARISELPGLRAILLDNSNQLLGECSLPVGADPGDLATPIAGLLRQALAHHATAAIVLRHSGAAPATLNTIDYELRGNIEAAADPLSIRIHDLIVVGQGRWVGMRDDRSGSLSKVGVSARRDTACGPSIAWEPALAEEPVGSRTVFPAALADLVALARSCRATTLPSGSNFPRGFPMSSLDADIRLVNRLLDFMLCPASSPAVAGAVVHRFGSFGAVLAASEAELRQVAGLRTRGVRALKLVHAAVIHLARVGVIGRPVRDCPTHLADYLSAVLACERVEQLRILFLDARGMLLVDEVHSVGTINHTSVYPREVVRRALEVGATAVVLAHNHPSGDPTPSDDDIAMTRIIGQAAAALAITLQDHIIVGDGCSFSFREAGLLSRNKVRAAAPSVASLAERAMNEALSIV